MHISEVSSEQLWKSLYSYLPFQNVPLLSSDSPNVCPVAQSVGAVEYIDCISTDGSDFPKECPVALSVGTVEYTDCISIDWSDFPNECPVAQSVGAVEYTVCISAEGKTPLTNVLWPSR